MSRGSWDDFTDKYGFNDGDSIGNEDWGARRVLVLKLNAHPAMQRDKIRAIEYDRGGMHNSCLIALMTDIPGRDDDLLVDDERQLPGEIDDRYTKQELPHMRTTIDTIPNTSKCIAVIFGTDGKRIETMCRNYSEAFSYLQSQAAILGWFR